MRILTLALDIKKQVKLMSSGKPKQKYEIEPEESELSIVWLMLKKNKGAMFGLATVLCLCFIAVLAPLISPYDPLKHDLPNRLRSPSAEYLLGQDEFGRCILSRIFYGARISLYVGLLTVSVSMVLGITAGTVAGYYGGKYDTLIMRLGDIFLAFPGIILAMGMMAALGRGISNVILALAIVSWPSYARVVRSQTLSLRETMFVDAARAMGASNIHIIVHHVLPNLIAPLIVLGTLSLGWAILSEAGLSFLGLGVNPPTPSWGSMVSSGRLHILGAFYLSFFPGLMISITVLSFNMLGDGLRDALDPSLRI